MISLRLLTATKIKLIGKLLLLGLKSGTAFYIESHTTWKSGTTFGRVCRIGFGASVYMLCQRWQQNLCNVVLCLWICPVLSSVVSPATELRRHSDSTNFSVFGIIRRGSSVNVEDGLTLLPVRQRVTYKMHWQPPRCGPQQRWRTLAIWRLENAIFSAKVPLWQWGKHRHGFVIINCLHWLGKSTAGSFQ